MSGAGPGPSGNDEEAWRVLLLPGLKEGQSANIRSFTLPDPRTGRSQGFILANGRLLEVNRFKQAHSAWLTSDRLLSDGGMFIATAYDPLFVLLPALDRARDKDESCPAGKFKELDELLYDSTESGLNELLPYARTAASGSPTPMDVCASAGDGAASAGEGERQAEASLEGDPAAVGAEARVEPGNSTPSFGKPPPPSPAAAASLERQLACICDVRRVDESCYYRLNDQRALAWLLCKFRKMQAALAVQVTGMDAGHATSYVLALLGEYVGDPWVTRLAKHLGTNDKEVQGTTLQPTDANAQMAAPSRPTPPNGGPPEKKQKVAEARAVAKQAAMAKQAVGTKKLTSFFTKK